MNNLRKRQNRAHDRNQKWVVERVGRKLHAKSVDSVQKCSVLCFYMIPDLRNG